MARYLRNTESNAITVVQDDDDATWHTLLAQKTTPADANTSAKPLYEETSEAWVLANGGASSTASAGGGAPAMLAAEANPAALFGGGNITDWSVDTSSGDGMALNADGIHFDLDTGVYIANFFMQVAPLPDNTIAQIDFQGVDTSYADAGVGGRAFMLSTQFRMSGWFHMAAAGQLSLSFALYSVAGISLSAEDQAAAQLTYAGIDLLKIS